MFIPLINIVRGFGEFLINCNELGIDLTVIPWNSKYILIVFNVPLAEDDEPK